MNWRVCYKCKYQGSILRESDSVSMVRGTSIYTLTNIPSEDHNRPTYLKKCCSRKR